MLSNPSTLGGCVYYAQNREDLILQSFFPEVKKGFYVDVGAFDPDYDSVTKLFYLNGWNGINIEPQADKFRLFQKKRKRDINLNIGIADREGTLTLRTYTSAGLSTVSDEVKTDYNVIPDADTDKYIDVEVKVETLKKVLTQQKVSHIHFLKVDVEGFEYEVLKGNDWKAFRPEVICIEANHVKHDWRPILKDVGYEKVFDDNLNFYYVDKNTNRKDKLNYVKDVINDRGAGYGRITLNAYRLYIRSVNTRPTMLKNYPRN